MIHHNLCSNQMHRAIGVVAHGVRRAELVPVHVAGDGTSPPHCVQGIACSPAGSGGVGGQIVWDTGPMVV